MAAEKTATQYSSFHMSIDRPVRFRFGSGKWKILPIAVRPVIFNPQCLRLKTQVSCHQTRTLQIRRKPRRLHSNCKRSTRHLPVRPVSIGWVAHVTHDRGHNFTARPGRRRAPMVAFPPPCRQMRIAYPRTGSGNATTAFCVMKWSAFRFSPQHRTDPAASRIKVWEIDVCCPGSQGDGHVPLDRIQGVTHGVLVVS